MSDRAQACSDAIHNALFPRADAIHRMANSRRHIAEIICEHFPDGSEARHLICTMRIPVLVYGPGWGEVWRHITDFICGVPADHISVGIYSNAESISIQGLHLFRSTRGLNLPAAAEPSLMSEDHSIHRSHPASDPFHVAD